VRDDLEDLNLTRAGKTIGTFVLDDLSNWYVRLSRKRFWHGEMTQDKHTAYTTLHEVLLTTVKLLAPFVPFVAEEVFRGLTASVDPAGSVHLQDFPVADAARQDQDLEYRMSAAQAVVSLGRAMRQDAGLKVRQPLSRLLLHSNDERADMVLGDATLVGYIAGELNLKAVERLADPREVATLAAKPNFRALGPRFGKDVQGVAAAVATLTPEQVGELRRTGEITLAIDGRRETLTDEEIQVREEGIPPFVAAGQDGLTVALDTTLTEALRAEGLCREIINKVQNLRKKSGLEVADRIQLIVSGAEAVQEAVAVHADWIRRETLAASLASSGELPHHDTFQVEEVEISIALAKV
jgi:isoleucyl-tRNA synthetase